jgi:hypothetical protein
LAISWLFFSASRSMSMKKRGPEASVAYDGAFAFSAVTSAPK